MPERLNLRASDADRERVAEQLRQATTEGRLTAEELEERLHAAFAARTYGELDPVLADLPSHGSASAWPGSPAAPQPGLHPQSRYLPVKRTNGMAIASIVLALFWMWGIGSICGLVLGLLAMRQINRSGGSQTGRGMAIAGITLGTIGLIGAAAMLAFTVVGLGHHVVIGPGYR